MHALRRPRRSAALAVAALLAGGCKADPRDSQALPPAAAQPGDSVGSAAGSAVATHVKLPRSPATPPRATTRPLDRAELDRLAAFEFADFEHEVISADAQRLRVRHLTASRPKLAVAVAIERCASEPQANPPCLAMELADWQPRTSELRAQSLPPVLRDRPDTQFELGVRRVAGSPAIYTYQAGWSFGPDNHGQPGGTYSDSYTLYYNDRINQIRVRADYADDAMGSARDMLALAPKEDLEKLAVAFLDFYVHEWK